MCDSMNEYELKGIVSGPKNDTNWQWAKSDPHNKVKDPQIQQLDKQQLKRQQRQLQNYCAQLLDTYEDNISAALQKGSNASGKSPSWQAKTHDLNIMSIVQAQSTLPRMHQR